MDLKLSGKVVVITGGSSGIGKAIAEAFAKEGSKIAVCARNVNKLEALGKEFSANGYELYTESVDVTNYDEMERFADNVVDHYGRIDVWINNAGQLSSLSIGEMAKEEFQRIIETNFISFFSGTKIAAERMKKTGGGSIINTSSYASLLTAVYRSAYSTSKWAINGLTKISAGELGPFGIRVNAVAPGTINTEMQKAAGRSKEDLDKLCQSFALRRMGEPEEVANVYLFLASHMASYLTGLIIEVSGGKFVVQNADVAWQQRK